MSRSTPSTAPPDAIKILRRLVEAWDRTGGTRYDKALGPVVSEARIAIRAFDEQVPFPAAYNSAVEALQRIVADGEPYFEDGSPAFHPEDDSIRAARAALAPFTEESRDD